MAIDYQFKDESLLLNALTHSSYANENWEKDTKSNERLEFLGDSVLSLICAEYVYSAYRDLPEGEMTKLRAAVVCESSLYEFALEINLGDQLMLGRGEKSGGGKNRPSVLSDTVEAVLAAIYLDGGLNAAKGFILDFIRTKCETILKKHQVVDYKTALQEIVQKNREEILSYRVKSESGPDHDKRFVVEAMINSNPVALGEGRSKKLAEQAAARAALELMGQ